MHWLGINICGYIYIYIYRSLGPFDLEINLIRIILPIITISLSGTAQHIILMLFLLIGGTGLSLQYYKGIPFFNMHVSVWFGASVVSTCWISFNAVIMSIMDFHGHVTVIIVAMPLIYMLLWNLRKRKIKNCIITNFSNLNSQSEGMLKLHTMIINLYIGRSGQSKDIRFTGIIQSHNRDCNKLSCPLHDIPNLYDGYMHVYASDTSIYIYILYILIYHFRFTAHE